MNQAVVLPNAMVATLTLPALHSQRLDHELTSLAFSASACPPARPRSGIAGAGQGQSGRRPGLGLTGFFIIALMLSPADLHRRKACAMAFESRAITFS